MSDAIEKPSGFSFWVNTILVIVCFLIFAFLVSRYYLSDRVSAAAVPATLEPEKRAELNLLTPAERAERLSELRAHAAEGASSYAWIDKDQGIVRLPIDRAIELYAREQQQEAATATP